MSRRFIFVGVTTSESSMMRIFPRWRDILGLDPAAKLLGRDLPINAPGDQYRQIVSWLKRDLENVGALVTTHKIDLYQAACDLFDELDDYARLLEEVSCIALRDGRLHGWAKDPISAGQALANIISADHFARTGGEVLCFGAGGAGHAITLHLLASRTRDDRPRRIAVTDQDAVRLQRLKSFHARLGSDVDVHYVHNGDPHVGDELVAGLPQYSLVINATGMGKDRPGSPVSDNVRFPRNGVVWELNYRGELGFLHQALAQRESRALTARDGWSYFVLGWTTAIEEVFQRPISHAELKMLHDAAAFARPRLPERGAAGGSQ